MQNLPQIVNRKHKLENGNPVPSEKMNEWGHPSSEYYEFAGSTVIRSEHTRVDEKTDEKRKVLVVSYISTWKPISNEKTATQLKKEKAQRKAKRKSNIPKPKKRTKEELKDECRAFGLPVGGNKADLEERLDRYYKQVADVEGYNDDAKEEGE